MITSREHTFLTEILEGKPIPVGKLEYFRARLQSRLHQAVLDEWLRQEDRGLSQAELARRIGKKPEVINRLLGSPGNWTLNTVSDLLLGMACELDFAVESFVSKSRRASVSKAESIESEVIAGQRHEGVGQDIDSGLALSLMKKTFRSDTATEGIFSAISPTLTRRAA
jgi:hypothetical protein